MFGIHGSHKQLVVLEYAKEHNIILFCFPPHCTHRVQPLDIAVYGPLRTYYNQAVRRWLSAHPGRGITHYQVGELFNEAYSKAASISNAQSSFSKTGICPFNSDIFPDWMFEPAKTTNVAVNNEISASPVNTTPLDNPVSICSRSAASTDMPEPTCSRHVKSPEPLNDDEDIPLSKLSKQFIEELSPTPQATLENILKKREHKKGLQGILNSTPEIALLHEKENEIREKERRKSARKVKRRVEIPESNEEDHVINTESDDEDDPSCIYCNPLYSHSRSRETWIRCQNCRKWAHAECAGISPKTKTFICEICI